MTEVYIVGAVRTATGRRGGALSEVHPVDLLAEVLQGLFERTGADPGAVDDVIGGCLYTLGVQAWNIARNAWLSAGFPEHVPAVTIDRQCGSSQQAVHFGAQAIMAGQQDLVVACGVECMSQLPLNITGDPSLGFGYPFSGKGWTKRFGDQEIHQFRGGDLIAERWGITRDQLDQFAMSSHRRADEAARSGVFDAEILPINGHVRDEGIRSETNVEKLSTLKPIREGGIHTAAHASQIADGASALLLASEQAVEEQGLTPLARVHAMSVVGSDPVLILTGPIPATRKVLARADLAVEDIDRFECNEAFGGVVLAWAKELGIDMDKVNVSGGAQALGHAIGNSGTRLMTTLVHELQRSGSRYGLQTMCEGGGLANATILERV